MFLALVQNDGKNEVIHVIWKNKKIKITDHKGNIKTLTTSDFSSMWTGTIIAIEISSPPKKINIEKFTLFNLLALVISITLLFLIFQKDRNSFEIVYTALSFLALGISSLVIKEAFAKVFFV